MTIDNGAPKFKFEVGQTVYRVEQGRYSGGVRIEAYSKPVLITKTTVTTVFHKTGTSGWGANRKTTYHEYVNVEGSQYDLQATRANVLTETQYAAVKDMYEAALAARDEGRLRALAQKRLYVQKAIAAIRNMPDQELEQLVMDGQGPLRTPSNPTLTCTVCWQEHRFYGDAGHEAVYATLPEEVTA